MTIDMSQFYQVFFEETDEHLSSMESLLVGLNLRAPDAEDVNAIFRAAHSIKGSSGTFGFDDMMAVTHVLETLLDRVRRGETRFSPAMVDACLVACDVLRNQLGAHRGGQIADAAAAANIQARLQRLCDAENDQTDGAARAASKRQVFELRFVPEAGVAGQPEHLRNLLDELGRLGDVDLIEMPEGGLPPSQCRLHVTTDVPVDALYEVVGFLAEPGSVKIAPPRSIKTSNGQPLAFDAHVSPGGAVVEEDDDGFFDALPMHHGHGANRDPDGSEDTEVVPDDAAYRLFTPVDSPAGADGELRAKAAIRGDDSIRVSVDKVDQLINLVGELVITQAMLEQSSSQCDPGFVERINRGLGQLQRNTRDLQESVMSIRMLPISTAFSRFQRVVRDLSAALGKQVELQIRGENTEMDKNLIERIVDPLTHLVRNSLDHGIETPVTRQAAGKPETGTITLSASHQGGSVVIEVSDDGAGLDRMKILSKARQRGISAPDSLSDSEVWQLVFEPGLSTAEGVTEVSGRGVGMDVVMKNIAGMGGRVDINSIAGKGTRTTVRLPLTLAILDGMSVRVGSEIYIIPLNQVAESLQVTPQMVRRIAGEPTLIQVRGEYLNVVPLHRRFNVPDAQTDWSVGIMVVLETGGARTAVLVDELLGQHQVVIKSLEANFRRVAGVSGATILGDGRVAMILDAPALVGGASRRVAVTA